jgi:hypothetical protein
MELLQPKELFLLLRHIINQDNIYLLNPYPLQETGDKDIKLFTSEQGIDYILEMLDYSSRLPDPIIGSIYTLILTELRQKKKENSQTCESEILYFILSHYIWKKI